MHKARKDVIRINTKDLARIIYNDMKKGTGDEPVPSRKEKITHETQDNTLAPTEVYHVGN